MEEVHEVKVWEKGVALPCFLRGHHFSHSFMCSPKRQISECHPFYLFFFSGSSIPQAWLIKSLAIGG